MVASWRNRFVVGRKVPWPGPEAGIGLNYAKSTVASGLVYCAGGGRNLDNCDGWLFHCPELQANSREGPRVRRVRGLEEAFGRRARAGDPQTGGQIECIVDRRAAAGAHG